MENNNNFEDLFKELRNEQIEAPPYIETQIMSRLKERQRSKLSTRIWKMASVGLMAVLMVVGGRLVYISGDASFKAEVEKPYVVRVELNEFKDSTFAEAEIILPEGVYFYSKSLNELNKMQSLRLAWDDSFKGDFLPFVIKSNVEGRKLVKIKFYDAKSNVMKEKMVNLVFQKMTKS